MNDAPAPTPRKETNPDCPHGLRFAARRCSVCRRAEETR